MQCSLYYILSAMSATLCGSERLDLHTKTCMCHMDGALWLLGYGLHSRNDCVAYPHGKIIPHIDPLWDQGLYCHDQPVLSGCKMLRVPRIPQVVQQGKQPREKMSAEAAVYACRCPMFATTLGTLCHRMDISGRHACGRKTLGISSHL